MLGHAGAHPRDGASQAAVHRPIPAALLPEPCHSRQGWELQILHRVQWPAVSDLVAEGVRLRLRGQQALPTECARPLMPKTHADEDMHLLEQFAE